MNTCCSNRHCDYPDKHVSPLNGRVYSAVNRRTVLHQVKTPWARDIPEQGYYFCTDPDCEVVYFGEDDRLLRRNDLRTAVGQKSQAPDRLLCYCFDIRESDARSDRAGAVRQFVIEHTRDGSCDCAVRKPSGRCCLKEFPDQ